MGTDSPDQGAAKAALKVAAAERAAELVESGMLVGLGSGSTAAAFIKALGRRVAAGLRVQGLAPSLGSAKLASACGIPQVTEPDRPLDLAVDGADEIDPRLNLVKGGGGALFREKLVALSARRFIIVADESKLVDRLGRGPVPVEVLPFLWRQTAARLRGVGATVTLREDAGRPFVTDNGNHILLLGFDGGVADPAAIGAELKRVHGVLEHGLFCGMACGAIVAGAGGLRTLGRLD
ncbi:MAG: ribose-5-phosphate isomerase RpiA [Candidatus Dormibacteraeota bacterium]|nr:ribose-5-phosphate isomerase RpiA [Candidatus Dormibacteraeota bacterium]